MVREVLLSSPIMTDSKVYHGLLLQQEDFYAVVRKDLKSQMSLFTNFQPTLIPQPPTPSHVPPNSCLRENLCYGQFLAFSTMLSQL